MKSFKGLRQAKRRVPYTFTPIPKTFFTWLHVLKPIEATVYMAIAGHTLGISDISGLQKIPMSILSQDTGLHRASISRAIKALAGHGLISVKSARKAVSAYEILTPPYFKDLAVNVATERHKATQTAAVM
jgi:hypothetical protein